MDVLDKEDATQQNMSQSKKGAAVCFIFYELASFGHRVLVFVQKQ